MARHAGVDRDGHKLSSHSSNHPLSGPTPIRAGRVATVLIDGEKSNRGDLMSHRSHPRTMARRSLLVAGTLAGTVAIAMAVNSASAAPPPPPPPAVPCVLTPATGSATQTSTTVTGGPANDTIDCTNARPGKTITGGLGDDTITGTAFNDTISGGDGNDTLTGGNGNDSLTGGNGNDTLTGSAGDDTLNGDAHNDTLNGGVGNDKLTGTNDGAADTLNGDAGTDNCKGFAPDTYTTCNP